jgi:hypothetical protein
MSLPDANMQHHLVTCCLDITSLPYGSTSYWWILAATTFRDNKKCVTPQTFKQDEFFKWVTMLNCHSCAPSAHMPHITWPWTLEPYVIYFNSIWNFKEFSILKTFTCKLFLSTLTYSLRTFQFDVSIKKHTSHLWPQLFIQHFSVHLVFHHIHLMFKNASSKTFTFYSQTHL